MLPLTRGTCTGAICVARILQQRNRGIGNGEMETPTAWMLMATTGGSGVGVAAVAARPSNSSTKSSPIIATGLMSTSKRPTLVLPREKESRAHNTHKLSWLVFRYESLRPSSFTHPHNAVVVCYAVAPSQLGLGLGLGLGSVLRVRVRVSPDQAYAVRAPDWYWLPALCCACLSCLSCWCVVIGIVMAAHPASCCLFVRCEAYLGSTVAY